MVRPRTQPGQYLAIGRCQRQIPAIPCASNVQRHLTRMQPLRAVLVHPRAGTHTGIRLAKSGGTPDNSDSDTAGMAKVADSLSKFCQ